MNFDHMKDIIARLATDHTFREFATQEPQHAFAGYNLLPLEHAALAQIVKNAQASSTIFGIRVSNDWGGTLS